MAMPTAPLEPWRPTMEAYIRLVESGALEDERVELLDGQIVAMSPRGLGHDDAIEYLTRRVCATLPEEYGVRVQSGMTIGEGWAPEPDLLVVSAAIPRPYHPQSAHLACEVASSSLARDRLVKRPMYARAGVPEYWIVAIPDRAVEVHRRPDGTDYRERLVVRSGLLTCAALPALSIDVDALWAMTFR